MQYKDLYDTVNSILYIYSMILLILVQLRRATIEEALWPNISDWLILTT